VANHRAQGHGRARAGRKARRGPVPHRRAHRAAHPVASRRGDSPLAAGPRPRRGRRRLGPDQPVPHRVGARLAATHPPLHRGGARALRGRGRPHRRRTVACTLLSLLRGGLRRVLLRAPDAAAVPRRLRRRPCAAVALHPRRGARALPRGARHRRAHLLRPGGAGLGGARAARRPARRSGAPRRRAGGPAPRRHRGGRSATVGRARLRARGPRVGGAPRGRRRGDPPLRGRRRGPGDRRVERRLANRRTRHSSPRASSPSYGERRVRCGSIATPTPAAG